ncbi:MAG TPA: retroviral-like aspartic protease family protein [Thermoanaerobaculia bacterium]
MNARPTMVAEVPFRLTPRRNPLILVPVFVEGKGPYEFILDTGASISLLSTELARSLGVAVTRTEEGVGAGGNVSIELGRVGSLSIGETELHDVEVGLTDELARIGEVTRSKIDGDIGYNVLNHFRVTVDYGHNVLKLSSATGGPCEEAAVPFEIAPTKPLMVLPVEVNGSGPYRFCLDTGTSMTAISPAFAARLGIPMQPGDRQGTGAGGKISVSFGRLASLAIGHHRSSDLEVTSADFFSSITKACGTDFDGIVGYNFLKSYRLTIDYPQGRIELEPGHRNRPSSRANSLF